MRFAACFVMLLMCAGLLGCRSEPGTASDSVPDDLATASALVSVAEIGTVVPYVTLTPWPTFTPIPTATRPYVRPTLPQAQSRDLLELTPEPTLTPSPTVPLPTVVPVDVRAIAPDILATPTRAPFQLLVPDTDIAINRQTLFVSQVSRPPEFWPKSQTEFYTRTARYIGWFVNLDYSWVDPDFKMDGTLRWLNVTTGGEHVIFQRPFVIDASLGDTLFFMTGKSEPGFWSPGRYRVELWDNRDRVIVRYDFSVLSGSVN